MDNIMKKHLIFLAFLFSTLSFAQGTELENRITSMQEELCSLKKENQKKLLTMILQNFKSIYDELVSAGDEKKLLREINDMNISDSEKSDLHRKLVIEMMKGSGILEKHNLYTEYIRVGISAVYLRDHGSQLVLKLDITENFILNFSLSLPTDIQNERMGISSAFYSHLSDLIITINFDTGVVSSPTFRLADKTPFELENWLDDVEQSCLQGRVYSIEKNNKEMLIEMPSFRKQRLEK
jgi:hypothetical protein